MTIQYIRETETLAAFERVFDQFVPTSGVKPKHRIQNLFGLIITQLFAANVYPRFFPNRHRVKTRQIIPQQRLIAACSVQLIQTKTGAAGNFLFLRINKRQIKIEIAVPAVFGAEDLIRPDDKGIGSFVELFQFSRRLIHLRNIQITVGKYLRITAVIVRTTPVMDISHQTVAVPPLLQTLLQGISS